MNLEDLQRKLSVLQRASGITDEQLTLMEQEQARREQQKADRIKAEAERQKRDAERTREIRALAAQLVASGRLQIEVNGIRIEALREDLCLPCPSCGAPINEASTVIYTLAEGWHGYGNNRFVMGSPLMRPPFMVPLTCPACNVGAPALIQLMIVK